MRNYQRQKNNPYKLPHNLYMRMLYLVRDYDRLKAMRDDVHFSSPVNDGIPCSGIGNPTEHKAIRLAFIGDECHAIESAFLEIPEEYRKGIKDNICYGTPYPYTAHRNTYSYWRVRLLHSLAKKTGCL